MNGGKIKLPIVKNYEPYQGDDFGRSFAIMVNGSLEDISGDTFKMRIEDAVTKTEFLTIQSGSGIENPSIGRVAWELTKAQTADFLPGRRYRYDLQWTRSTGKNITIQKGIMTPDGDTTPP
mgnify:CR=1 FL=1